MDNIQFHHSKETMEALARKSLNPLFSPPYSPEFNAIEMVFAEAKKAYRRLCPVGVDEDKFDYRGQVDQVFTSFKHKNLTPFFEHVISYVERAKHTIATNDPALTDMIGYKR